MSTIRALILSSLAAVALADGLYVHSNELAAHFAKRQQMPEPGTAAYNCHDNCGQSIIASRGADPCHDKTFLTDYAVCLSCAGPDNYGIWMYYGGALTKAANSCGLATTPGTEKTTDVPKAIPAAKSSSAAPPPTTLTTATSTRSPATTGSGSTVSTVITSHSSSAPAITSTATAASNSVSTPPTASPTVLPTAGASSAVCIKLYAIFLLSSHLFFTFGF